MKTSESINELAAALAKAQGEIQSAHKDCNNPFFKSKYADLSNVWEACRGPLSKNGLSIVQLPRADGPTVTMETRLMHASGQWVEGELTAVAKDDGPQSIGSLVTYLRRYMLQAVTGVAPDDDDGNAAQGDEPRAAKPKSAPKSAAKEVAETHGLKTGDQIQKPAKSWMQLGEELVNRANNFELVHTCEAWIVEGHKKRGLTDRDLKVLTAKLCTRAIENVHFAPDVQQASAFLDELYELNRITQDDHTAYYQRLEMVAEGLKQEAAA